VVGLVGDYALVADPSWGRRVERWVDFAADKGFSGVVLVPVPEAGLAAAAADAQRLALEGAARELRRLERVGAEVGRRWRPGGAGCRCPRRGSRRRPPTRSGWPWRGRPGICGGWTGWARRWDADDARAWPPLPHPVGRHPGSDARGHAGRARADRSGGTAAA